LFTVNRQILRERPSLVLLDTLTFFITLPILPLARSTRFIIDYRTFYFGYTGAPLSAKEKVYKAMTLLSFLYGRFVIDGFSFIVPEMLDFVGRYVDVRRARYFIWSSGVDLDTFVPAAASPDRSPELAFFYHGHLTDNRGLDNALLACRELLNDRGEFSFTIIGDGPARDRLAGIIRDHRLETHCFLTPAVPYRDVVPHIAAADVALMPYPNIAYFNFNNPIKLLEYMSMRKFIIITDVPAFRPVVQDYPAKYVIGGNSAREVAAALRYCLERREAIRRMRVDTAPEILRHYTYREQARRIISFAES